LILFRILAAGVNAHRAKLDRDSKIDPDLAHGIAEFGKRTFRVLSGIADYNVVAAA
jgi:hypothetical protein